MIELVATIIQNDIILVTGKSKSAGHVAILTDIHEGFKGFVINGEIINIIEEILISIEKTELRFMEIFVP